MNNQPQEVIDMLRSMIASQQDVIKADNEMIESQDIMIDELRDARNIDHKLIVALEEKNKLMQAQSDEQYRIAVFYKEQWEETAEGQVAIKGE